MKKEIALLVIGFVASKFITVPVGFVAYSMLAPRWFKDVLQIHTLGDITRSPFYPLIVVLGIGLFCVGLAIYLSKRSSNRPPK